MANPVVCLAFTKDGDRCGRMTGGGVRCGIHERSFRTRVGNYGPLEDGFCSEVVGNNHWCRDPVVEGTLVCQHHLDRFNRRHEDRQRAQDNANFIRNQVMNLTMRVPAPTWQNVIRDYVEMVNVGGIDQEVALQICQRYAGTQVIVWPMTIIPDYWNWVMNGEHGPAPELQEAPWNRVGRIDRLPTQRLAALSQDTQNVHTPEVNSQTNKSVMKLLEIYNKECHGRAYRSPEWSAAKWLTYGLGSWEDVRLTVDDMVAWYNKGTCVDKNDRFYKKLLDGLYFYIYHVEDAETKKELYKRLFQECRESVGMCCQGHVSRLCNVLVGFDDAFKPPLSASEILQTEIPKIASSDLSDAEKIKQATELFDRINLAADKREEWLAAIAAY